MEMRTQAKKLLQERIQRELDKAIAEKNLIQPGIKFLVLDFEKTIDIVPNHEEIAKRYWFCFSVDDLLGKTPEDAQKDILEGIEKVTQSL